jgi:hypothetical protein
LASISDFPKKVKIISLIVADPDHFEKPYPNPHHFVTPDPDPRQVKRLMRI